MLDVKLFREDPDLIKASREKREFKDPKVVDKVIRYDSLWRKEVQKSEKVKGTKKQSFPRN